ncbi:hypothetical protein K2X05_05365, partial [bacterium]|nr:hypothetical protein [bacterium]
MLRILMVSILFLSCSKNSLNQKESQQTHISESRDWDLRAQKNIKKILSEQKSLRFSQDEINHLQWVAKASLLLRGQKELSSTTDDINHLKSLNKEKVVDLFLNTPEFYNSVVDFSLYYIGFRVDPFLLEDQTLNPRLNHFTQTIFAAQAVSRNESFLNVFELFPPKYLSPFEVFDEIIYHFYGLQPPTQILKSNFEKREAFFEILESKINDFKKLDEAQAQQYSQNICQFFIVFANKSFFPTPSELFGIDKVIYNEEASKQQINLNDYCTQTFTDEGLISKLPNDFSKFTAGLEKALLLTKALKQLNLLYDSSKYKTKSVLDFHLYKTTSSPLAYQQESIFSYLVNSSTNMNRKRSAYILKHFFCDDLTPVNVKIDDDHTNNAHGSNPSCYACHYKLDPMAGFFKNYGIQFFDFSSQTEISFDDGARIDLATYQKQWLKPDGKTWNIGYIQSTQFDHLNQYGESLEDLHKILQTTP